MDWCWGITVLFGFSFVRQDQVVSETLCRCLPRDIGMGNVAWVRDRLAYRNANAVREIRCRIGTEASDARICREKRCFRAHRHSILRPLLQLSMDD